MTLRPILRTYGPLIAVSCLLLVLWPHWAAPAQAAAFGGRAVTALVALSLPAAGVTSVGDTGDLPADGGWQGATLLALNIPGALTADALVANTSGGDYDNGPGAASSTSLGAVTLFPGAPAQLTASFVRAQAGVSAAGPSGWSEVDDLVFAGLPITVTGQANQRVEVLGVGTLVINEQSVTSLGTSQSVTVNALHLKLVTGEEVVLSSARSAITW